MIYVVCNWIWSYQNEYRGCTVEMHIYFRQVNAFQSLNAWSPEPNIGRKTSCKFWNTSAEYLSSECKVLWQRVPVFEQNVWGQKHHCGCVIADIRFQSQACITTPSLVKWAWWRHQVETFSALLALCVGNSPVPVNSPHKGQWLGALMFALICVWINSCVNNREAGDLRRYCVHYGVTVMVQTD